jgi:P27 family predicted phage terminase small subunit
MPQPRKPTALLAPSSIAKGGARYADRANEPKYAVIEIGEPPSILMWDELACQVWRETAAFLNVSKVMTVADINHLILYCQTFADWRRDEAIVALDGRTVPTDRGGMQKHPLLAVISQNKALLNTLSQQFGMTPASRSKVTAAPGEKPKSTFAED